jgi:hypothetical protein
VQEIQERVQVFDALVSVIQEWVKWVQVIHECVQVGAIHLGGCNWVQFIQEQVQVIDNMVQVIDEWVQVIQEWVQMGASHL